MTDIAQRAALVTGAASGIGRAVVAALVARGVAGLVLIDRDAAWLDAVARETGDVPVLARAHDVADETAWEASEAAIRDRFGTLGEAVVNAGVADNAPIVETSLARWRALMAVNLDGAMLTLRTAMRLMPGGGAIVTMCSAAGVRAMPGAGAYAASKAGLLHLTRVAALEGASTGIRVNALCPGGVKTAIWKQTPGWASLVAAKGEAGAFAAMAAGTPLKRFATPDEVARDVLSLLVPGVTTGACLVSDGGFAL